MLCTMNGAISDESPHALDGTAAHPSDGGSGRTRRSVAGKSAVIDIGTNTLLLLIVDQDHNRLVDVCRFGRLGQGLDATGRLADDAIARSLDICREYGAIMDKHDVAKRYVIATQALREAANREAFVQPAEELLGAPVEIVTGAMEAELAHLAVARTFPDLDGAYVVCDVGGGSSEFIVSEGSRVVSARSLPIGAVRLAERHLKHDPPTPSQIDAMDADIATHLATLELPTGVPLVGTAGTATTMAAVTLALHEYDPDAVTGARLLPATVGALRARLLGASIAERRMIPGMEAQRADVIPAGVAIYAQAVARIRAPVMITCDRGIRWGIVYQRVP